MTNSGKRRGFGEDTVPQERYRSLFSRFHTHSQTLAQTHTQVHVHTDTYMHTGTAAEDTQQIPRSRKAANV